MAYDIIGDIHGQADKLEALLAKMGYRPSAGCWRHADRKVIFVGDFVDRGPAQMRTVELVRRMVEEGAALAVMGNHELNAIAWHTPDPAQPGEFLRPRHCPRKGAKNRHQHQRFLEEVEHRPEVHADTINWFLSLPLWLDLDGLRVVHACWHQPFMDYLAPRLDAGHRLDVSMMSAATSEPDDEAEKDSVEPSVFKAVEALTKGLEIPLPSGHVFRDSDGIERNRVRVRWWDAAARTYPQAALLSPAMCSRLPHDELPAHARIAVTGDKPLFFGHYWMTGEPTVLSGSMACVDYSAGKGGPLVAYRWDGEARLSSERFCWTD